MWRPWRWCETGLSGPRAAQGTGSDDDDDDDDEAPPHDTPAVGGGEENGERPNAPPRDDLDDRSSIVSEEEARDVITCDPHNAIYPDFCAAQLALNVAAHGAPIHVAAGPHAAAAAPARHAEAAAVGVGAAAHGGVDAAWRTARAYLDEAVRGRNSLERFRDYLGQLGINTGTAQQGDAASAATAAGPAQTHSETAAAAREDERELGWLGVFSNVVRTVVAAAQENAQPRRIALNLTRAIKLLSRNVLLAVPVKVGDTDGCRTSCIN
jgi:hypothetical protein